MELNIDEFNVMLKQVNDFMAGIPKRIDQVKEMITYHHNELLDMQHYIEFNKLNASEGWKIQSDMREVLNKRRVLKDELDYLEAIEKKAKGCLKQQDGLSQIIYSIRDKSQIIEARVYSPRVRKELFENKKVKL